mmetsp:Transcript_30441/g.83924  ORF Transcript_30441/g.83924 Transcript_30441/m.83924 type:complete len:407 (-) Transcript_30441:10-1230(-)
MCGKMDVSRKFDMALDDLVEASDTNGRRSSRTERPGPYTLKDNRARRRIPSSDKALLNTQCFYNSSGDLVVQLYDTQVLVFRKRPAAAKGAEVEAAAADGKPPRVDSKPPAIGPGDASQQAKAQTEVAAAPAAEADGRLEGGDQPSGDAAGAAVVKAAAEGPEDPAAPATEQQQHVGPAMQARDGQPEDADKPSGDAARAAAASAAAEGSLDPAAPATEPPKHEAMQVEDASQQPADMVPVLTSGTFRTPETRYILNEGLQLLGFKVVTNPDSPSQWKLEGESMSVAFEDGMQVDVRVPPTQASSVKQHLSEKIQGAKAKCSNSMGRGERRSWCELAAPPQPVQWWGPPSPHAPHWPAGALPPSWGLPPLPPPGWGAPPPPQSWHGVRQGLPWNVGPGPLPDDLFQ